jgi:hypothetical protein
MTETNGNAGITNGNSPVTLEYLSGQLTHVGDDVHDLSKRLAAIEATLSEHMPLLARARALMDPGAGMRAFMGRGKARADAKN